LRGFFGSPTAAFAQASSRTPGSQARFAKEKALFAICTQNQPETYIFLFLEDFTIKHATNTSFGTINRDAKFSPDGQYLAVGVGTSPDLYMFKWDGSSLALVAQFNTTKQVRRLAWNPDGTRFAVIFEWDNYVRVYSWDGSQISFVTSYELPGEPHAVHWSRCGGYIAVGHEGSTNLTVLQYQDDAWGFVAHVACSGVVYSTFAMKNAAGFVVGTDTAPELEIYKFIEGMLTRVAYYEHGGEIYCLDMNDDENLILVSSYAGNKLAMYSWDGTNLDLLAKPDPEYGTASSCFSPDEQYIASAKEGELRVFRWDGSQFHYIEQAHIYTKNRAKYIDVSSVV